MTEPFTLAHLSDPHLPPLPAARLRDLAGKRALGYLTGPATATNIIAARCWTHWSPTCRHSGRTTSR